VLLLCTGIYSPVSELKACPFAEMRFSSRITALFLYDALWWLCNTTLIRCHCFAISARSASFYASISLFYSVINHYSIMHATIALCRNIHGRAVLAPKVYGMFDACSRASITNVSFSRDMQHLMQSGHCRHCVISVVDSL
jgi:hypothetical protein